MSRDYLKVIPHYLAPKNSLTRLAGLLADVRTPAIKKILIQHFIKQYQVDMSEAQEENSNAYACFNDFFIRHLKPEIRPLSDDAIVSPVDGVISQMGCIEEGSLLQAKGSSYSVENLLATHDCAPFKNGTFATFYLAPHNYHRIHMPISADLQQMRYIPGKLFSVQPLTTQHIPALFTRNQRLVTFFNTERGPMAMVLVGATLVGSIGTSWHGDIVRSKSIQTFDYTKQPLHLQKGQEMGYFKLGSTVILLFANAKNVQWLPSIQAGTSVQFGQGIGA